MRNERRADPAVLALPYLRSRVIREAVKMLAAGEEAATKAPKQPSTTETRMTQQEETTGQPGTKEQKDEMFRLGSVLWHTSDPEGGGPDVGISVGTGDCCIYAGEVPGLKGGWSLVIYTPSGREDIAETVNREQARDFIERLGRLLNDPPSPSKQIEEACRALRMENTEDRREKVGGKADDSRPSTDCPAPISNAAKRN